MTLTHLQIKKFYEEYLKEIEKFHSKDNQAAKKRAVAALDQLITLIEKRRTELVHNKEAP